jgi:hypothetical protein
MIIKYIDRDEFELQLEGHPIFKFMAFSDALNFSI